MKRFRRIIFWSHFVIAAVLGLVIGTMALTGAGMAFRDQITAWAERDVRRVAPPASASSLPLREIMGDVREARPDARPFMLTVSRDPAAAVIVSLGRGDLVFVNPYTGEVKVSSHARLRNFFETLEHVHRWLGLSGRGQQVGLLVTIGSCAAFALLLLSGIYLWWPRVWTAKALWAAMRLRFDQVGKARDWNWHTTLGFWLSPIILFSTCTGLIMGYPRISEIVFGRPRQELGSSSPGAAHPSTAVGRPLSLDVLLAKVEATHPKWETITARLQTGPGDFRRRPGGGERDRQRRPDGDSGRPRQFTSGVRMPTSFSVKESGGWPIFATQITFDPVTGELLSSQNPAQLPFLRMLRLSARPFHVGEALGPLSQVLIFVGALGAVVLVITGFSLALRRMFFGT